MLLFIYLIKTVQLHVFRALCPTKSKPWKLIYQMVESKQWQPTSKITNSPSNLTYETRLKKKKKRPNSKAISQQRKANQATHQINQTVGIPKANRLTKQPPKLFDHTYIFNKKQIHKMDKDYQKQTVMTTIKTMTNSLNALELLFFFFFPPT